MAVSFPVIAVAATVVCGAPESANAVDGVNVPVPVVDVSRPGL